MQKIVISENMDAPAVALLARDFDVDYRPALVDDAAELAKALALAEAWIVRNRTQVRGAGARRRPPACASSAASAWASTTSTSTPAPRAASR